MTSLCSCQRHLLERQGYRELAASHLFSMGVPLAPSLDEKQMLARHCLDELEHFEAVAMLHEEEGGEDLIGRVAEEVRALPRPETWLEMVVIGIVFDRAVYYQLRAYAAAPDPRVASFAVRVIADEQEHLSAGQSALSDLEKKGLGGQAELDALVARWLPHALACFDEPLAGCPHGPHVSEAAQEEASKTYLASLAALLVPRGVAASRFAR